MDGRKYIRRFLFGLGFWIPLEWLLTLTKQKLILPFYHTVSDQKLPHLSYLYNVRSKREFEKDLDGLLKKYRPVMLTELLECVRNERPVKKPSMFLSFDDGLSQAYNIIVPLLEKKGVPAAFFLNPDFLDNKELFFKSKSSLIIDRLHSLNYPESITEMISMKMGLQISNSKELKKYILQTGYNERQKLDEIAGLLDIDFAAYLKVKKPYLTNEQVKNIIDKGFYAGAHSMDHPLFNELDFDNQLGQAVLSIEQICDRFNLDYRLFAFPFTDDNVSRGFFRKMFSINREWADLSFGTSGLKKDEIPFHLHRIPMEDTSSRAMVRIKEEYLYYLFKGLVGRNITRRKP